jgi:hypothetical protein
MSLQTKRLKTAQINLRISRDLAEAARRAAAADARTLTSLVEKLLGDFVRDRGYLPAIEPPKPTKSGDETGR